MGGAESGMLSGGCSSSCNRGGREGGREGGTLQPPSLLSRSVAGSGLVAMVAGEMGEVDLLTSTCSFVGDDNDRFISDLAGDVDLLTSDVVDVGGVVNILTADEVGVTGVVNLLTSIIGETGSVDTYLLDSETVERGRRTL